MKIAALVLIGLMSQTVFAGETKFSFYLGQGGGLAGPNKVAVSKLAQHKDLSAETLTCVGDLKSKLAASPKFRSVRHLVKEVIFYDLGSYQKEKTIRIRADHDESITGKRKANTLLMDLAFARKGCTEVTVIQIDQEIDAWLAQYAVDTAAKIKAIEKLNESDTEKAQSDQKRKNVESAPVDPRAGRIDDVRRRIQATEADGGVDTGRIR